MTKKALLLERIEELETERNKLAEALAYVHARYIIDSGVRPGGITARAFAARDEEVCRAITIQRLLRSS